MYILFFNLTLVKGRVSQFYLQYKLILKTYINKIFTLLNYNRMCNMKQSYCNLRKSQINLDYVIQILVRIVM